MNKQTIIDRHLHSLQELRHQQCWSIIAGEGVGSEITIDFGDRTPRQYALKNPFLTEEQRTNEGSYILHVLCTWRLDSKTEIICGSNDPNKNDGIMVAGLERLVGQTIRNVEVITPAYDLVLTFDDFVLRVFCDEMDKEDEFDNYSFFTPDMSYTVECRSRNISLEDRCPSGK